MLAKIISNGITNNRIVEKEDGLFIKDFNHVFLPWKCSLYSKYDAINIVISRLLYGIYIPLGKWLENVEHMSVRKRFQNEVEKHRYLLRQKFKHTVDFLKADYKRRMIFFRLSSIRNLSEILSDRNVSFQDKIDAVKEGARILNKLHDLPHKKYAFHGDAYVKNFGYDLQKRMMITWDFEIRKKTKLCKQYRSRLAYLQNFDRFSYLSSALFFVAKSIGYKKEKLRRISDAIVSSLGEKPAIDPTRTMRLMSILVPRGAKVERFIQRYYAR